MKDTNVTKQERLQLRISEEDKKNLKIFCIENGYKSITDFIMSCYNKEKALKNQNA